MSWCVMQSVRNIISTGREYIALFIRGYSYRNVASVKVQHKQYFSIKTDYTVYMSYVSVTFLHHKFGFVKYHNLEAMSVLIMKKR